MHSYCLRAVENYRDAFKLMYITEIKRFNSRFYFYCVNNRINPLTVTVDLSRLPPIITERQSYVKLPKELWDRTKYIKRYKRLCCLKVVSLIPLMLLN